MTPDYRTTFGYCVCSLLYQRLLRVRAQQKVANAKWRKAHPEKAKAYERKWRGEHRERLNARGRVYSAMYRRAHPEQCKAREQAWRDAHRPRVKELARANQLRRDYGLTLAQYEQMVISQLGKCAICGEAQKLCVDHCHTTGKVRGLLCRTCNSMLGHLKDSEQVFLSAINYLKCSPVKADVATT